MVFRGMAITLTYTIGDEENGNSKLVLVISQAELLLHTVETSIADTDCIKMSVVNSAVVFLDQTHLDP